MIYSTMELSMTWKLGYYTIGLKIAEPQIYQTPFIAELPKKKHSSVSKLSTFL